MEGYLEAEIPPLMVFPHYCTVIPDSHAVLLVPEEPRPELFFRLVWRAPGHDEWEPALRCWKPSISRATRGRRSRPIQRMLRTISDEQSWEHIDPKILIAALKAESSVSIHWMRESCSATNHVYFSLNVHLFHSPAAEWQSEKFDSKEQAKHPYFARHPSAPY